MQAKTTNQAKRSVRQRSHFTSPTSSIPSLMLSTFRLKHSNE